MTADYRRPWRAVLALCALLAGALSYTTPTAANDACEELQAWAVATYARTTPTLDELTQLDRAHRIAAFGVLTPSGRAALWQEHLRQFAARADLSAVQRSLIREGMTLLTPAVYGRETAAVAALQAFRQRAEPAFAAPELRQAWFDLGAGRPGSIARPKVDRVPYCDCNTAQQDCWGGRPCTGAPCNLYAPGCGFAQTSVCDGLCG